MLIGFVAGGPVKRVVRDKTMRTPKQKITLAILAALYWLAAPFIEVVFYSIELSRGIYLVNADSIAVPIFQFSIGWLIFSPFVVV